MEKEYEVIIVGAGPAGCSAAICLARQGCEVLLIDKAQFPRDKVCGDGIGPPALGVLDRLGVLQVMMDQNPWKVGGIEFFSPAGQRVRAPFSHLEGRYKHGWVFPRREFDFLLWQHVRSFSNVHLLENCEGVDLIYSGGKIAGVQAKYGSSLEDFRGKVILGADGAYSRVAKRISFPGRVFRNYAFGVRGYFRQVEGLTKSNRDPLREKPPARLWLDFPHGGRLGERGGGNRLAVPQEKRYEKVIPRLYPGKSSSEAKIS